MVTQTVCTMSFRIQFFLLLLLLFILVGSDLMYVAVYNEINFTFEISLFLVTVTVIGLLAYVVEQKVFKSFRDMRLIAEQLLAGQVLSEEEIKQAIVEQKQALETLRRLSLEIQEALQFIDKIGKNDFSMELKYLNPQEGLGKSLTTMRQQLQQISAEKEHREWSVKGIAKFSELLRNQQKEQLENLAYYFIKELVDYLNANQGAVYVIDHEKQTINCIATYAYSRRKFVKKSFAYNEGLVGRCVADNETIYIDDIPNDYIHITSGLGEAPPRAILLSPIQANQETYGVVEMASFHKFEEHQIKFVQEICEDFGSILAFKKRD